MTDINLISHAYWLGVRDARMGLAETHPIRPFTAAELKAYRQGYSDQKINADVWNRCEVGK